MIICLDSMVCVWAIKKQANEGQKENLDKAKYLLEIIDGNKWQVIIPTVVIAEILMVEPVENYQPILDIINKNFIIADFDTRAATKYSQILNDKFVESKAIAKDNNIGREKMKIDHLILACALVNGATSLYSHDGPLKTFATGLISVKELPTRSIQETLFP